jgi:hypothetical protein
VKQSAHRQRILAALLALENAHRWNWWSRDAIGHVVAAGGFHATIQLVSMGALKRAGLVQTERSSWSKRQQALTRCNCACHHWGLTDAGRHAAQAVNVRWTAGWLDRLRIAGFECSFFFRDEDDWRGPRDDDDDDDFQRDVAAPETKSRLPKELGGRDEGRRL